MIWCIVITSGGFPTTDFEYSVKDDSVISTVWLLRDIVSRVATSTINVQRYNMAPFIQIVSWRRFGRGFVSVGRAFGDRNPPAGQFPRRQVNGWDFPQIFPRRNLLIWHFWWDFLRVASVFRWTQLSSLEIGSTSARCSFRVSDHICGSVKKKAFQQERISGISDWYRHIYQSIFTFIYRIYVSYLRLCNMYTLKYTNYTFVCPGIGDTISTSNPVWSTPFVPGLWNWTRINKSN